MSTLLQLALDLASVEYQRGLLQGRDEFKRLYPSQRQIELDAMARRMRDELRARLGGDAPQTKETT